MKAMPGTTICFRSPEELRKWFAKSHGAAREPWVGFHKAGTGTANITWPESVDEQLHGELAEPYAGMLRGNEAAWQFFQAQPPRYRKKASRWLVSAKKEQTRLKRLAKLATESAQGRTV